MTVMKLADDFPPASLDTWRKLVDKALKGGDFERRLVSRTADGIAIAPLYTRSGPVMGAGSVPAPEPVPASPLAAGPDRQAAGWDIRQIYAEDDPAAANAAILEDLAGGVTSLELRIAAPGQFGLPYAGDAIATALAGVSLDACPVALDAGEYTTDAAGALIALWRKAGIGEARWRGAFNYDPLGTLARTGALYHPLDRALAIAGRFLADHRQPGVRTLLADGRPFHEAGASEAQELAAMLAACVAYLRAAEQASVAPADALAHIGLALAADADQLMTIAKLRAARRLLARIAEACGAAAAAHGVRLSVTTSYRMMTRRDPWVNMLRTTMACASAAIAGADSIAVLPFTWALGRPDAFARRIARNTHHVLIEESGLDRVVDPAAGSFAIEALTSDLARKAWEEFQAIEAQGGLGPALVGGLIAERIAATAEARGKLIATGRLELTGTSAFPKLGPDGVTVAAHPLPLPADLNGVRIAPLVQRRLAEPFEALRDAADAFSARHGAPPRVFLASLGPLAVHSTRSTWITNFLAAGGIEAIATDGFDTSAEVGRTFASSGACVACICSTDEVYAERGEAAAAALKSAGATRVYLAGRPKEQEPGLRAAGVDAFIFAGVDAIATLAELHRALGVS
jgi:methylmalonyl-CoA mutase